MKRFVIQRKLPLMPIIGDIPTPAEVAEGFGVVWSGDAGPAPKMVQHGTVSEEQFVKLQHKFEDTGFYLMFDDTSVHTH
jgi:hypothetical protein